MRIGNLDISLRRDKTDKTPPTSEGIISSSSILQQFLSFDSYNPDDLIGRRGFQVYQKMLRDEQLKVVSRFRRNAVTTRGWDFKFEDEAEDKLSDQEKELRKRVFSEALKRMDGSFRSSLNKVLSSINYGFSIVEKTFKPISMDGRTYWGIKALRKKPFDTFYFITEPTGELKRLEQRVDGKTVPIDMSRIIHHVHNPEVDEYYGQSELREAYRSWWSKDVVIKMENIFTERMAGGFVWVNVSKDGSDIRPGTADYQNMQQILSTITGQTGILVPKGHEMHVEVPKDSQAFDRAKRWHDKAMAKAMLMPDLLGFTDRGDTGSRALGDTQLEAFLWMLDAEADDLAETLNEQLIWDIGDYNFGDGLYPTFFFKPLSDTAIAKIAEIWGDLVTKGAVTVTDTDEAYLRELLEMPEAGEEKRPRGPAQPQPPGGEPPPADDEDTSQGGGAPGGDDETIVGRKQAKPEYRRAAFNRAMRRVNFAQIDKSANVAEFKAMNALVDEFNGIVAYIREEVSGRPELLENAEEAARFSLKASQKQALRETLREMLADGWDIGAQNATQEMEKAKREVMKREKFAALSDDAARRFLDAKSFTIAGTLSDDVVSVVRNLLFNGIKFSKSEAEVTEDIINALARKGMVDRETAEEALGAALEVENPVHRLNTVVRTNMFEAVNEARFSFFTDPELEGFVTAMEYSAILDSRTTEICTALDNFVAPADASEWDKYRPPNHFNCRSILVPVTVEDEVEPTGLPNRVASGEVQPQEGFG